jgi:hypothetical protein
MFMHILDVFAEFERNIVVARVNSGVAEAEQRGGALRLEAADIPGHEDMRLREWGMSSGKLPRKWAFRSLS